MGIFLEPKHGNTTTQRVRAAHPIASAPNARLQDLLLQASLQALGSPSADAVRQGFGGAIKKILMTKMMPSGRKQGGVVVALSKHSDYYQTALHESIHLVI